MLVKAKIIALIMIVWLVVVLLLLSLPTQAKMAAPVNLEWQAPSLRNDTKSFTIHFKAEAFPPAQHKRTHLSAFFSGEVIIAGSIGQLFIICAHQADSGDLIQTMSAADNTSIHSFRLEENSGTLAIRGGSACPETIKDEYPYHTYQLIRSKKPFLAIKKQKKQLSSPSPDPFKGGSHLPAILSGANQGFDDNDFKYPPFMPVFDKYTMDLLLLPVRLPDNWRNYLPFAGLYYWLAHQPETPPELTLLIRFNGADIIRLRISRAEYTAMAENLLNAQQLLYWLTSKLNGHEAFIHRLLGLQQLMASPEPEDIDDIASEVRQQLVMILEQPQTEFSLEFETGWLANLFHRHDQSPAGLTAADKPDATKFTFDRSSPGRRPGQKETSGTSGQSGSSEYCDSDHHMDKAASDSRAANKDSDENIYVLWVNGVRFYLRDKKIQNDQAEYRDLGDKHVTATNDRGKVFPLSEIEKQARLEEPERLYRLTQQGKRTLALDYLLYYGDADSLRAFFYRHPPVSLAMEKSEKKEAGQRFAREIKHNYPQEHHYILTIALSRVYQRSVASQLKLSASNYRGFLFYCVRHELIATTDILLGFMPSVIHDTDTEGNSILHVGAKQSPEMMQFLLACSHHRPNRKNRRGYTPLHIALKEGQFENARLLYEAGSNPDIAAGNRKKLSVRQLYPPSADEHLAFLHQPRARKKLHAPEQFIKAIEENNLTGLLVWLENSPDIATVFEGKSPIQMAATRQLPDFIKVLFLYHRHQQLEPVISNLEFNDLRVLVHRLEVMNGLSSLPESTSVIYESAYSSEGGMLPLVKNALETFLTEYLRPLILARELNNVHYIISQLVEQHHLPVELINLNETSKSVIQTQCLSKAFRDGLLNYQQFVEKLLEQKSMEAVVQLLKDEPCLQLAPVVDLPFLLQVKRVVPEIAHVLYDYAQKLTGHHRHFDILQSGLTRNPIRTPMAQACKVGSLPVVDMLLNLHGTDSNYPELKPLHIAVEKQNRMLVLKLLANNVNEVNSLMQARLVAKAKANGDIDIARALEYRDFEGLFWHLIQVANHQVAARKPEAPPFGENGGEGVEELLHIAVETGELCYVDWLLSRPVALDSRNSLGKTPLESALDRSHFDIARKLFEQDQNRQLFDAVRKGKIRLLRQLAEIGAQFDVLQDSCSLLYTAVENNQVEITRWLLDRLPPRFISQRAVNGQSPLTLAKAMHYKDIIDLLEHSGQ